MSVVSVTWRGTEAKARARRGSSRGLTLATEFALGEARKKVPHEEGTLERSGRATVDDLEGAVSFNTPYAVEQHENLTLGHDPGRTAKYLENAVNSNRDTLAKLIAEAVRRELGT